MITGVRRQSISRYSEYDVTKSYEKIALLAPGGKVARTKQTHLCVAVV